MFNLAWPESLCQSSSVAWNQRKSHGTQSKIRLSWLPENQCFMIPVQPTGNPPTFPKHWERLRASSYVAKACCDTFSIWQLPQPWSQFPSCTTYCIQKLSSWGSQRWAAAAGRRFPRFMPNCRLTRNGLHSFSGYETCGLHRPHGPTWWSFRYLVVTTWHHMNTLSTEFPH